MDFTNTITSLTDDSVKQADVLATEIEQTLNTAPTQVTTEEVKTENTPLGFNSDRMPLNDDIELEEIKSEAQPLQAESSTNSVNSSSSSVSVQTETIETEPTQIAPIAQPIVEQTELNTDEKIKIAINGFGRIGRQFFKVAFDNPNIQIVAINDLGNLENLAYLLEFDTVYKRYDKKIAVVDNSLEVDGKSISFIQEKEPAKLPWKDLNVDIVIESTGFFTSSEKAKGHLDAGAKRVVISAPAKDDETPTATPNNNTEELAKSKITSNASCTTNAATPIAAILDSELGIESIILNTIHGYTGDQSLVDGPHKDFRRGRSAAQNIIPTSSGASLATEKAVPSLKGKSDALAMRVPVVAGSILDFTFISKTPTSVEEINNIFRSLEEKPEWGGIITFTEKPLVSSDILQNPHGSIIDLNLTRVVNKNLVKVCAWYDNEWGYVNMLLKHVLIVGKLL